MLYLANIYPLRSQLKKVKRASDIKNGKDKYKLN